MDWVDSMSWTVQQRIVSAHLLAALHAEKHGQQSEEGLTAPRVARDKKATALHNSGHVLVKHLNTPQCMRCMTIRRTWSRSWQTRCDVSHRSGGALGKS